MNSKINKISVIKLILVFWISLSCKSVDDYSQNQKLLDSYIKQTTIQEWIGGQPETGSGIDVHIYLHQKLPKNIEFTEAQLKGSTVKISYVTDLEYVAKFKNPLKEETSKDKLKEGQIKIFYSHLKKKKFALYSPKKKELLAYPSMGPKENRNE